MLIPDLVHPTFTDAQTFFVIANASGIEFIKILSPLVQPLCTNAEKPPKKSIPNVSAALSNVCANLT